MRFNLTACLLSLGAATLGLAAAVAEPVLPTQERFILRPGAFFVRDIDVTLRVDGRVGAGGGQWDVGTEIDLSEALNIEQHATLFRFDFSVQLAPRHQLNFSWFDLSVDGLTTLDELIDFGDTDFGAGLTVKSKLRTDTYRLNYTYFLVQKPDWRLGLSFGAHIMGISAGITAVNSSEQASESLTAPLPVLGLQFEKAITDRLTINARTEFFKLDLDEYSGDLFNLNVAMEYRLRPHWSLGGGLEYFQLDYGVNKTRTRLDINYRWTGIQVYFRYHF